MTTTDRSRAELVASVWDMHSTSRMTVRAIAAETGLSVGTVHNYIQEGRAAEGYIKLLDIAEQRMAMAERLDAYTTISMREHLQGMKWDRVLPLLIQLETRRARLLGLDMPLRIANENGGERPEVDADNLAAVREMQQRAAAERRELGAPLLGEDGVDQ